MQGILNFDKPPGISSARVVAQVKRLIPRGVKIGHAGTLDPFAMGVLLLLIGPATRRCEELMALPKQYDATIKLGATTATDDPESPEEAFAPDKAMSAPGVADGTTPAGGIAADAGPLAGAPGTLATGTSGGGSLLPHPLVHRGSAGVGAEAVHGGPATVSREAIDAILPRFIGQISQRPPAFSAMKVQGRRAYALARAGERVELAARTVRVDAIEVLDYHWPLLRLRIDCGRGTYIRALARDLGAALGVGGYLTALRRTRVGQFSDAGAVTLETLKARGVERFLR